MLVRRDLNVEAIGTMAQLPPDLSPLQLAARGEFDGLAFTLIGRLRLNYDEGSWNEWYAKFADGRHGWVAEAQGFFMVSFECDVPPGIGDKHRFEPGLEIKIADREYSLTDHHETVCIAGEGELPFVAKPGRESVSADFTDADGGFASIEIAEGTASCFVGSSVQFDDLHWTGLREVPGWSGDDLETRRNQTAALQCPSCGGTVELRAVGFSMSAVCQACGSVIDTATPELKLIRRAWSHLKITPAIPLGRRGILFGVNYEAIGCQRVKDQYGAWIEYLLFNPWQGFAWLVTYNGHWSFVRRILDKPEMHNRIWANSVENARYAGGSYRKFAEGNVSTDYVLGEFYWKLRKGMAARVTDFVCPPQILSREIYPDSGEISWSHGVYVEPKILQQAFNLEPLHEPVGYYLNQPNPYAEKRRYLKWIAPIAIVMLVVIQIVSSVHAARKPVSNVAYVYHASDPGHATISSPFEIAGGYQAVQFTLQAPVDNNWLEIEVDLVDASKQTVAASFEEVVEYYHGYDDGPWSEGKQTKHHVVPSVAPGKYYLTVQGAADPAISEMPLKIEVVRDVVVWSNFWIALAVLMIYPVYCWFRAEAFERARWMESDFSPYGSSSDE